MEEHQYKKAFWILVIFIVLSGLAFAIYYLFVYKKSQDAASSPDIIEEKQPAPVLLEKPIIEETKKIPELEGITLDNSDDVVSKLVRELSSHPQLAAWLMNKDLIRKFTVVIENIVKNASPRSHVKFLAPKADFQVIEKNGKLYVNPESYRRYDLIAEVFASLDPQGCAELYKQLKPLIQEAYQELGYPTQDFDEALFNAFIILLKTPVVEGDILLEKKVIRYKMMDRKLEKLSTAQKHMLRMGPQNMQKIQGKLREIARALGMPDNQLPQPSVYSQ